MANVGEINGEDNNAVSRNTEVNRNGIAVSAEDGPSNNINQEQGQRREQVVQQIQFELHFQDEFLVFGSLVASKLRNLNPQIASIVQQQIYSILTNAEVSQYNELLPFPPQAFYECSTSSFQTWPSQPLVMPPTPSLMIPQPPPGSTVSFRYASLLINPPTQLPPPQDANLPTVVTIDAPPQENLPFENPRPPTLEQTNSQASSSASPSRRSKRGKFLPRKTSDS